MLIFLLQQLVRHLSDLTNTPAWGLTLVHRSAAVPYWSETAVRCLLSHSPETEGRRFRKGGCRSSQLTRRWPLMFIVLWRSCQAHIKVLGLISTETERPQSCCALKMEITTIVSLVTQMVSHVSMSGVVTWDLKSSVSVFELWFYWNVTELFFNAFIGAEQKDEEHRE